MNKLSNYDGTNVELLKPLAERLRPLQMSEVLGQEHITSEDGPIGRMLKRGRIASTILWGPPGSGKTTVARLMAHLTEMEYIQLSAVFSGVSELRKIFLTAKERRAKGLGTVLFVDEIHRFNRSQQDAFLPVVEDGTIVLIGATTENPSFTLNAAILSRCQVLILSRLRDGDLENLLQRAEESENRKLPINCDARRSLRAMADGDGRYVINLAEELFSLSEGTVLDVPGLMKIVQRRVPLYDKDRESHYNLISALHKSLRGSDADAALYWLARMMVGGEEPLYIARRLVRFASEDIGLADPSALVQALSARDAYEVLGSPEGELALAQCVIYLATAPKSNSVYRAFNLALERARSSGSVMPPKHILNAPTNLMKSLGYGDGYQYDHDVSEQFSGQNYFPEEVSRQAFYTPGERGFERDIRKRLLYWEKLRNKRNLDIAE